MPMCAASALSPTWCIVFRHWDGQPSGRTLGADALGVARARGTPPGGTRPADGDGVAGAATICICPVVGAPGAPAKALLGADCQEVVGGAGGAADFLFASTLQRRKRACDRHASALHVPQTRCWPFATHLRAAEVLDTVAAGPGFNLGGALALDQLSRFAVGVAALGAGGAPDAVLYKKQTEWSLKQLLLNQAPSQHGRSSGPGFGFVVLLLTLHLPAGQPSSVQETQAQEARPDESSGMRTLPAGQLSQPMLAFVAPGAQPRVFSPMQLWRRGQVLTTTLSLGQEVQPVPRVHWALVQPMAVRAQSHSQASGSPPVLGNSPAWHFPPVKWQAVMPLKVVSR